MNNYWSFSRSVCRYRIHVYTGDVPGAETKASVYLTVFGLRGDTGRHRLIHNLSTNALKFARSSVRIMTDYVKLSPRDKTKELEGL